MENVCLFTQKKLPKGRHFTYLEDPDITGKDNTIGETKKHNDHILKSDNFFHRWTVEKKILSKKDGQLKIVCEQGFSGGLNMYM